MLETTAEAIEVRDLGEMLAALCQVAQDAACAEGASQGVERLGAPRELQSADQGVNRP